MPPWIYGLSLGVILAAYFLLKGRNSKKKDVRPIAKKAKKKPAQQQVKKKKNTGKTPPAAAKKKPKEAPDGKKKINPEPEQVEKNRKSVRVKKDGIDRAAFPGYIPVEKLPKNSQRIMDEAMTYREFLLRFPEFEASARINASENVLVVRTATVNSRGQTIMSTTVYSVSPVKLLIESAKAE